MGYLENGMAVLLAILLACLLAGGIAGVITFIGFLAVTVFCICIVAFLVYVIKDFFDFKSKK